MRPCWGLFLVSVLAMKCAAQNIAPPDQASEAGPQATSSEPAANSSNKGIDGKGWLHFVPDVLHDQQQIWLSPVSVAKGRHLKSVLVISSITAGLVALDPAPGKYFEKTQTFQGFNRVFSGPNTALAMELFPAAFYVIGLARKDLYAQKTFLLAGEAVLSSEILTTVMKDTTRRLNPGVVKNGSFSDTWFKKTEGSRIRGIGSFPSGHTIAAFSIATVFAKRYPHPRWIPYIAYGLATVIGFSRITLQSHFPSDVFLGGALGYSIANMGIHRGL
jgi:membrane-associated phospholipid phosphatase